LPPPAPLNCRFIEGSERDSTQDWVVPRGAVPTVGQLEARIDEALMIARASEAGVREVGELALEAARQARRAAEAAEASATAAALRAKAQPATGPAPPPSDAHRPRPRLPKEDPFARFCSRADRLSVRLERLQRR
jgi:hypothetical protein